MTQSGLNLFYEETKVVQSVHTSQSEINKLWMNVTVDGSVTSARIMAGVVLRQLLAL